MQNFLHYSGIALWAIIALLAAWLLLRWWQGKTWLFKAGSAFFLGSGLMRSAKKLAREVKQKELHEDTLAEVAVRVFWRLTRIGLVGLLIAAFPVWLLWQQNSLIRSQNELFKYQNEKITTQTAQDSIQTLLLLQQTELFRNQNEKLDTQTRYMDQQNSLADFQNKRIVEQICLMDFQNDLLGEQNDRLNLQNNLIEADRRGALVILMSNIMDQMNEEINKQKEKDQAHFDSVGYSLSDPLIGRIAALSQGFLPYRYLEGDTLTEKAVSPERGQLLLALVKSNLDSITYDKIYRAADFGSAYLEGADLGGASLSGADLHRASLSGASLRQASLGGASLRQASLGGADLSRADLSRADLFSADLSRADLLWADLRWANLRQADLRQAYFGPSSDLRWADFSGSSLRGVFLEWADLLGASLSGADLRGAYLNRAKNLTADQLKTARSLYECRDLDPDLQQQLQKEKPCLFTKEGCK